LPDAIEFDEIKAHEMTRHPETLAPPRDRDGLVLVRGTRDGTYWQAPDGLIVRVAAREVEEGVQRELLDLACRDAAEQSD
jgi:hypothetical protein